jgi:hypothetical protein
MGKRGIRSAKGQPENEFGEVKSKKLTLKLTGTGRQGVHDRLAAAGLTVTRFMELLGRGYIEFQVKEPDDLPLTAPQKIKPLPKTIQEALAGKSVEELAAASDLPVELIQCILDGDRPTAREAIALARATPGISGRQMWALAKKQYDC